jgi:hypothetical protein
MSANCAGRAGLFEAVDPDSHRIAKTMCDGCDFIDQCRKLRDTRDPGGGIPHRHGTWAGELWINGKRVEPEARRKVRVADRPTAPTVEKGKCQTCRTPVLGSHRYCEPHRIEARIETQRRYDMARARAKNIDVTRACGQCGVDVGVRCVTKGGQMASESHYVRRAVMCECGVPARPHSPYCETCRVEARREMHRQKAADRYAATKRDEREESAA